MTKANINRLITRHNKRHCVHLRLVEVLQVLRTEPLLEGKVSQQLDVSLCNLPPAPLFLHHLFKTTQHAQTQLLQRLYI